MKKILLGLAVILSLSGCGGGNPAFKGYVPSFSVTGDVDAVLTVNRESSAGFEWTSVQSGGLSLPAIELAEVLAAAKPRAESFSLLLIGADGLTAMIDGESPEGCYIAYSDQYSWECINYNHPVSSRIKMLSEIVVVSGENVLDPGATGLVDSKGSRVITAGRLRLSPHVFELDFEGRSETGGLGVSVFTPHRLVPLDSLLESGGNLCFAGRDGSLLYGSPGGYLEIIGNSLSYEDMPDAAGIMADAPALNISEVYRDALYFLEKGERVMIIELDGWGWEMFLRADQPFLGGLGAARALAAFPPISPVGLATMLTGELPDIHGIHDRTNREPLAEDIFAKAASMGKKAAYVEGSTGLIKTSLAPVLSPEGTDEAVLANAKSAMENAPDLLFVHFHGIDETAHAFGPYAPETLTEITYLDGLAADLAAGWSGKIIITADHGLHETPEGGNHGVFRAEDILVPYIITDGGK